jgi:SAM-dependent methyltransferase
VRAPPLVGDRWWTFAAPVYDVAVASVGWHRCLRDLVAGTTSGRVLEVGCGPSYLGPFLTARGVDYVGVDRNQAMLDRAARGIPRPTLVRADLTALPFADHSFDVVLAPAVLGLLDVRSRHRALAEVARVARTELRLLEPIHRQGEPVHLLRSRVIGLVRERPLELEELVDVGLTPWVVGRSRLGGVYSVVIARVGAAVEGSQGSGLGERGVQDLGGGLEV